MWTVPLLAVTLDRAVRTRGPVRWAWVASTLAIYSIAFMWFNAWLYKTSHSLSTHYPTYVAALDAAIAQMTTTDKMFTVASHPALFAAVSIATLVCLRCTPHSVSSQGEHDERA